MAASASSRQVGEIAHLGVERALVEVDAEDDVEAGALQRRGDLVGVVDRIGKLRDLLVGGVADHERDALFRGGGECEEEGGCEEGEDAIQDAVHGWSLQLWSGHGRRDPD